MALRAVVLLSLVCLSSIGLRFPILNRFLPLRPNPLIVSEWYQAQGEGELPALANLTKGPRHCKL